MLNLLERRVRRQNINNPQIINHIEALVRLVRRAHPAVVLIEQEVLSFAGGVLFGEDVGGVGEDLGVGLAHDAAHGDRFGGLGAFGFAGGGFAADEGYFGLPKTSVVHGE